MRKDRFLIGLIISTLLIILQSTIMRRISPFEVIPDLSLIVVVFCSYSSGSFKGEIMGFVSGIVQDLLSSGPLGFNAICRTIIGFIYGKAKGKLFLDSILLPILFIAIASLLKEAMSALVSILFLQDTELAFFNKSFFIELGLNAVFSPIIFALLKVSGIYRVNGKDGY